ncbi:YadA-like family protein [Mitsuokella jalaludinii]|uniref:YadA-like family protein n=2 Tax=Mitsuokella jalaludinii TaxID=187979 RepID=UPI00242F2204|nr:YadA-like family protein [Mitsuokella jalaludinii]
MNALDQAIGKATVNLSTLDTQVKSNADAIQNNTSNISTNTTNISANTTAIDNLRTSTTTNLATKADVNASNLTNLSDPDLTAWGTALGKGTIAAGNEKLVTGGMLHSELRPATDGTYVKNGNTTATNLTALDTQIKNVIDAIGLDPDNTTTSYTSKLNKYFKVNPKVTTTDTTTTYDPDAVANGTNSVAIGPNAKTATYTTTVTSDDSTTTTETAADHAVAIGDGATVNAAGDQGIALGKGAVTGEAEASTPDGTTTTTTDAKGGESSVAIGDSARANGNQALAFGKGASVLNPTGTGVSTGSTAIGSGAKVDGGSNSIALGTSAVVNTVSDAMALGNGATINKTAKESIAIGKGAVTGGVDKPITLTNGTTGTLAAAGGLDSIAIGNGAVSEGNEALALGKGAKVTNGATGGDSAAAIVKNGSAAIGDGAEVANSATSMAIGNGASITEGENTTVIGSGAKATQTKQAFVAGYQASSDSSAESSVAIGDNASTHSARTTAIGYKAEAHNADSIAIGSEAKTDDNGGGIAIGNKTSVAQGGIAIGNATQASNISSLAIGNGAVANVNQSISIGYNAGVNTTEDYKERNGSLVAIGTSAGNNVKGMQNVAIGASAGSAVLSSNNIAIGTNAGNGIKNVTSETDTNPQNGYNISIGAGANYTEGNTNQNIVSSIAIGHATHAVNRAVAIGEGASAQGDSGMALGNSAKSSGSGSIAIGNAASAADGNIAFGAGAIASGSPSGNAKWTSQEAPKYYISVGNPGGGSTDSPMLRRISNVADGSDDHDVATVAQLQEVSNQLKNTIVGTDSDNKDVQTYSTTYIDNKVTELKNNISASKTKYFSVNPSSQTTNSGGTGANTDGAADAMAIGPNAKASSVKALAIGNNVSASGTLSIAIGTASDPSTDTTTAETPHPTSSEGTSSVAIGTSAIAQTNDSIAIGTRAATYTANTTSTPVSTVGVQSIAIGFSAETRDDNAISIGTKSKANSADAVAIGDEAEALNTNAVVIGKASTAEGSDSVTIGMSNANNGKAVITTGNSNRITNSQGVKDTVQNSGLYGSSNAISSVSSSNTSNAITDVYAVGNSNTLNQNGEKNVLTDVSIMGNKNTIENGTAGAYTQTVKQIAVVGSGNKVKGNTQIDYNTWGTVQRDTILGYKNTVDATTQWTPVSNLQILGNDVTATLGNSVYLGTGSSATASKSATTEAITLAKEQGDAEAIASDEYKKATTEAEQTAIKQKYEAQYIHAANIAAMDQDGISAGITNYDKDYTYGNDSAYTYAGSQATGVVTVGSKDATRRIQNVSAGLVGPNSTDAVNGSQLYALTRQIRFGGDNSTFGKTTAADDVNVVAKGSNEKLAITGGAEGVSNTTTTDGKSVTTVDGTKIADKNIAVIAEDDALHVKLASNLKNLNTAQLGKTTATTTTTDDGTSTTTYSYQETLKLDGTGDNGGTLALKDAKGENGVTLRTSGATKTADVTGAETNRLLVNDKTVATTDDGLKFGGDTGTDSALKLNSKLTVKGGATTGLSDNNNIGVVSDGKGTLTVKLNKDVNLGADGSLTTGTVTAATVTTGSSTLNTNGLTITGGPKFTSNGISANSQQIKNVLAGTDDTDAANYSQIKKATTTVVKGTNVDSVSDDTTSADGHHIYTVNVSNLGVKVADGQKTSVALSDGLVFGNGTNTTASVGQNGAITFNVSNDAIKTQAKDAINMSAGSNVKVDTATSTDGSSKTFTISATHNALKSATLTSKSNDVSTLTITGNDGDTASVDIKNTHLTVTKDSEAKTVTFTSNDGTTPATTLSLSDLGAASTADMNAAKAAASTEVKAGTNASLGTVETNQTDQHKIYTVNVDNLGLKQNGTAAGTVTLADGIDFADGTNTSATVSDGKVTFDLKRDVTGIDTVTANNSIQAGNVKVGKQGTDNKNYVTGLDNKNWTVGQTTYEAGRAATEDQLKSVSDKVASGFQVTDGTTSANIGADKKVTFTNGNYTTAKVTQATDGANVQYDINTAQINAGANGTISAPTTDGVATAANVAEAINSAAWNIKANDGTATAIKAGTTVGLKAGNNLTLSQSGTDFTYRLNDELTGIKSLTTVAQDGVTTTLAASGVTIASSGTGNKSVSLTANGLNNGGKQITDVASGGDTDTNAANISDVKRLVQASASGTTETGFNVKGDDATAQKVKLGKQLNVVGGTNKAEELSDNNIGVVTTADAEGNATLTVKLNKDITLDSVTAGNSTLDTNGLTIKEGTTPKVVITNGNVTMGGNVIHNVGDGVAPTDAVNKGQLEALQNQVSGGWNLVEKNSDGTAVTAKIGAGKTVTYTDGTYTKSVITKDDTTGNATVKVDVTTGTFGAGTGDKAGTVTSTANGLATTQDVATAVNNASWTIQDGNHTDNAQQVKAGDTVSLKAGDNLSLEQNGKEFTYKLNQTLTNMNSVTAVDDKQNTAVLNGEGLKVTDAQGNALTQHATEVRLHDANKAADDTTTDVVLNKQGLQNGGHTITGVADGKVVAGSQEAVNGGQLYDLQQKVGSGWKITGNNTDSTTSIGADKTVSFVNGKNSTVTVSGSDSGATVKMDVDTAELAVKDNKAVATGSGVADAQEVAEAINNAAWNVQKAGDTAQQVKAGDTVTFAAGNNMVLTQSGTSFTYGLAPDVNTKSIRLGGSKDTNDSWTGGIFVGKQIGGGANQNEGDYITGLDNTAWDLSKVVENRAATEGQLKAAINQVTIASQSGGFGLRDEKGSTVSQMLGQTVGIIGDTEYEADGKTVKKQGNITTEADSTNAGAVKVKLNKNLDLTEQGSVTIGTTSLTSGQAKVGKVTVNGTDNTVSGLANTSWDEAMAKKDGYNGSTKAATESQLQAVYTQATTTASANEQHIQAGTYDVMTQSDANGKKQNSVTMNIVDGSGNTKGQVVINDVAKASDVGDTDRLSTEVKTKNGGNDQKTSVVEAVNNLNDKVNSRVGDNRYSAVTSKDPVQDGDSSTTAIAKLNNRMTDIYTTSTQHSSVSVDENLTLDSSSKNTSGGTNYQIGLNKEKIDLGNVTIQGNEGSITAKSMKADTFTAGDTVVNKDGIKVGDKSALTGDSLKVGGKTYVDDKGINANGKAIGNVGDGKNDGDAVNVKQVNDLAARQGEAIGQNAAHINQLDRAVNRLDSRINRVGAGAAALAALHPGNYDPDDKVDFAAGFGNYRGASAAAVGMYYHPDETTTMSVGASFGGGENMVNAGITWKMGKDSGHMRTQAATKAVPVQFVAAPTQTQQSSGQAEGTKMPQPVTAVTTTASGQQVPIVAAYLPSVDNSTRAENDELKELLARQTAILEKLADQKTAPAQAAAPVSGEDLFPDVPENHWAYDFVAKLAQAGALKDCRVEDPANNPMLTRNDFAQILYTALKNGATKNPALNKDGGLNHLANEFRAELKNVKR